MKRLPRTLAAAWFLCSCTTWAAELRTLPPDQPHFRRPVEVLPLDGSTALVANRRSGTVSLVDVRDWSVAAEYVVGGRPSDLARWGRFVLLTDEEHSRLVVLEIDAAAAKAVWQVPVPQAPVSVLVSGDGRWCSVCSLWARKVTLIELPAENGADEPPKIAATIELPFSPREQVHAAAQGKLIVADAFGGRLAVISCGDFKLAAVQSLAAHNIRGLAVSADGQRLLVSHQILNELAPPRSSDIIWGVMITNGVRMLPVNSVVDPRADVNVGGRFVPLGDGGHGAGDPDALAVDADGRMLVALAGIGEVALVQPDGYALQRVKAGRRPVAVAALDAGRFLVADELGDAVCLVEVQGSTASADPDVSATGTSGPDAAPVTFSIGVTAATRANLMIRLLRLGEAPEPTAADRGEALFYDARVSHANWFSCHSCHTDGHTNGGLADTFGDGGVGAPKRVLSLLGVSETGPWAWKGDKPTLESQIRQSAELTMQGRKLSDAETADLVAFLKTLAPPPAWAPAASLQDAALIQRGRMLFADLDCTACHAGETLTSPHAYDVGLTDARGTKEFNPPSLRGVGHRDGLFHEKQAADLEEVVTRFRHQLSRDLNDTERQALLRFLRSL